MTASKLIEAAGEARLPHLHIAMLLNLTTV